MSDEQTKDPQPPKPEPPREAPVTSETTERKTPAIRIQKIPLETKIPPYFA